MVEVWVFGPGSANSAPTSAVTGIMTLPVLETCELDWLDGGQDRGGGSVWPSGPARMRLGGWGREWVNSAEEQREQRLAQPRFTLVCRSAYEVR